ncbi:GtrA family protein [Mycobacterium arosiense]|uniref:Polysaccharide synthesis protein GtrA n=1 Tax=Mycobacterium arosiense ATCC BAA-1401 = DSM 45069 TaxID=1265311 RepID=A0A1W9ZQ00_MYCAI|nr:GtrA family protein [Mycobacterium arosiense]ORA19871.1 polysaccharide synthesis protein GtrA [Mycobacterium arosiense ATCC BAA-1401 = DSM 45069]
MRAESSADRPRLAGRFHNWCEAVVSRLPLGLKGVVAPTFVGFCVINGFTFGLDVTILTALRGGLALPVPIAVTVAYGCAFTLSYILNRIFNFRSHAQVGPQVVTYAVVVVVNYLAFILGVTTALTAVGVHYQLSRLAAGSCEAVYMYSAMRWVVFRR